MEGISLEENWSAFTMMGKPIMTRKFRLKKKKNG